MDRIAFGRDRELGRGHPIEGWEDHNVIIPDIQIGFGLPNPVWDPVSRVLEPGDEANHVPGIRRAVVPSLHPLSPRAGTRLVRVSPADPLG